MNWLSSWFATSEDERRRTVERLQWLSAYGPHMQRLQAQQTLTQIVENMGIPRGARSIEGFQATVESFQISIISKLQDYVAVRNAAPALISSDATNKLTQWTSQAYVNLATTPNYTGTKFSTLTLAPASWKNVALPNRLSLPYINDSVQSGSLSSLIIGPVSVNGLPGARLKVYTLGGGWRTGASTVEASYIGIAPYSPAVYSCKNDTQRPYLSGTQCCSKNSYGNYTNCTQYNPTSQAVIGTGTTTGIEIQSITPLTSIPLLKSINIAQTTRIITHIYGVATSTTTAYFNSIDGLDEDLSSVLTLTMIDIYIRITTNYPNLPNYASPTNKPTNTTTDRTNAIYCISLGTIYPAYIAYLTDFYPLILSQAKKALENAAILLQMCTTAPSAMGTIPGLSATNIPTQQTYLAGLPTTYSLANIASITGFYSTVLMNTNTGVPTYTVYIERGFLDVYRSARYYILDSDLLPETVATKSAIYKNGSYDSSAISAALQDIVSALVRKYGTLTNTTPTEVVSDIPSAKTIYVSYISKFTTYISSTYSSITAVSFTIVSPTPDTIKFKVGTGGTVQYETVLEYYDAALYAVLLKNTYLNARRYLTDDELLTTPTSTTVKNSIYANTYPSPSDMQSAYKTMISNIILKYNALTGSTDNADVSTATINRLKQLQTTYVGDTATAIATATDPKLKQYEYSLYQKTLSLLNVYKSLRQNIQIGDIMYMTDDKIAYDQFYIDPSKIILREPVSPNYTVSFGVEYGPKKIYSYSYNYPTVWINNSQGVPTDVKVTYDTGKTIDIFPQNATTRTAWPKTAIIGGKSYPVDLAAVIIPGFFMTNAYPRSRNLTLTLPDKNRVDAISFRIGPNHPLSVPITPSLSFSGSLGGIASHVALAEITSTTTDVKVPITNTKKYYSLTSPTQAGYLYYYTIGLSVPSSSYTDTGIHVGDIELYSGQDYAQIITGSAINYIAGIYTRYKTFVDRLASAIFIKNIYVSYLTYRTYLSGSDISQAMSDYISKCEIYKNGTTTLQSGDTYDSLIQGGVDFINRFVPVFVSRYETLYNYTKSKNITTTAILPTTIDSDKTANGRSAIDILPIYAEYYNTLLTSIKSYLVKQVDRTTAMNGIKSAASKIDTTKSSISGKTEFDTAVAIAKSVSSGTALTGTNSGTSKITALNTAISSVSNGYISLSGAPSQQFITTQSALPLSSVNTYVYENYKGAVAT